MFPAVPFHLAVKFDAELKRENVRRIRESMDLFQFTVFFLNTESYFFRRFTVFAKYIPTLKKDNSWVSRETL